MLYYCCLSVISLDKDKRTIAKITEYPTNARILTLIPTFI